MGSGSACGGRTDLPVGDLPLGADVDPNMHDLLVAALEVHQRRTEELHAQLLKAFSAVEERIANALKEGLEGGVWETGFQGHAPLPPIGTGSKFTVTFTDPNELEPPSPSAAADAVHIDLTATGSLAGSQKNPPAGGLSLRQQLNRIADHSLFEVFVTLSIWCSVVLTFAELQFEGYKADVALGLDSPGRWSGASTWFETLDGIFNLVFVLEIAFLLAVKRCAYLKDPWGWFDLFLMGLSVVDSYILVFIGEGSGHNYKVIRIIRILRLTRVLRALRVARKLKILEPLHLFMRTIVASMYSLLWSMVFLAAVQLMGAMFVAKSLHHFIIDGSNTFEDRVWANRVFGSGVKSIYTFFEITFSGGWPNHVRPLMERVNPWFAVFFVVYISGWAFALMRIISALFINETFKQSAKDEAHQARLKNEEKKRLVRRLKQLFQKADTSMDGLVNLEEFLKLSQDEAVVNWFEVNEISMSDVRSMWKLLDSSEQEEMDVDDFVEGLLRMRGPAKAQDMMMVLQDVRKIVSQCRTLDARIEGLEGRYAAWDARQAARRGGSALSVSVSPNAAAIGGMQLPAS